MTTAAPPRVGWIGTGEMGVPLCERLLADGVDLTVWNRTRARAEPLAPLGARIAATVGDLAALDVVFVMVTADAAVAEVVDALVAAPVRPGLVVNCSTVSQQGSATVRRRCDRAGVGFLAAAISAGPSMVADGTAAVIASGPDAAFARAEPLLSALARTVVHAGPGDTAALVKLYSNVVMGTFTQSLFELADAASKAGVRPSAFFEFINGSVIGSTYGEFKAAQYLAGQTRLGEHQRTLMQRDFDLCLDAARRLDAPLPISEAARGRI